MAKIVEFSQISKNVLTLAVHKIKTNRPIFIFFMESESREPELHKTGLKSLGRIFLAKFHRREKKAFFFTTSPSIPPV